MRILVIALAMLFFVGESLRADSFSTWVVPRHATVIRVVNVPPQGRVGVRMLATVRPADIEVRVIVKCLPGILPMDGDWEPHAGYIRGVMHAYGGIDFETTMSWFGAAASERSGMRCGVILSHGDYYSAAGEARIEGDLSVTTVR